MRYLPLTDPKTAATCSRASASPTSTSSSPTCPPTSCCTAPLDLPRRKSELEVERMLVAHGGAQRRRLASVPFFVGAGAYKHHVPASVDHLIQRSEFLTSYTPYQPEIAQGTLQYLFEFQTQVARAHRHGGRQRLHV